MPLGDPNGGNFEYTVEGLPESIFAMRVPVTDLDRSVDFYSEMLGLRLLGRDAAHAYMARGSCRVILEISRDVGVDLGVYLTVDSPYNTHRRLVDEGVTFHTDPVRGPFGTSTGFFDPDRNILRVIEGGAEFRL